ncbi:MAG: hypothetical protein ACRD6W_19110 [Nitrososphaerales archaeon]
MVVPPHGSAALFVRQYLLYGKAWQRAGIVLALIIVGAAFLWFGNFIGFLPVLLGVVIGLRMWGPAPLRASRFQPAHKRTARPEPEPPDPAEDG